MSEPHRNGPTGTGKSEAILRFLREAARAAGRPDVYRIHHISPGSTGTVYAHDDARNMAGAFRRLARKLADDSRRQRVIVIDEIDDPDGLRE